MALNDGIARPALTVAQLIAEVASGDIRTRDLAETVTLLEQEDKPVLVIDERRYQDARVPWTQFSLIAVQKPTGTLRELADARTRYPGAARKGAQLVKKTQGDFAAYRAELEQVLQRCWRIRCGVRVAGLGDWRRSVSFGLVTQPEGRVLKEGEYAVIQNLVRKARACLNLRGYGLVVFDRAQQNGFDPPRLGHGDDELGAVLLQDPGGDVSLMLATTPEDAGMGDWLRLPDLDCALFASDPELPVLEEKVAASPDGELICLEPRLPSRFGY